MTEPIAAPYYLVVEGKDNDTMESVRVIGAAVDSKARLVSTEAQVPGLLRQPQPDVGAELARVEIETVRLLEGETREPDKAAVGEDVEVHEREALLLREGDVSERLAGLHVIELS